MIEVLQSGTSTTLQDAGRPGHRDRGIPASGAADRLSFGLANFMVGNNWDAPALECTLGGLHLRVLADTVMAIAGAEMWAQVNGQNVHNFTAFPVAKGDILTLSFARKGVRAYIAIKGGFRAAPVMGSVSTYSLAGLGGVDGRALRIGDRLEASAQNTSGPQKIPPGYRPYLSNHVILRARPGPEFDALSADSRRHLFISPFFATPQTDRMGARLRGNKVVMATSKSMASSPLLPGTLQAPPDGQPILALVDGHCTGGYARALQVIRADQWLMGQIGPETQLSFRRAMDVEAANILHYRNAFYSRLMPGFKF